MEKRPNHTAVKGGRVYHLTGATLFYDRVWPHCGSANGFDPLDVVAAEHVPPKHRCKRRGCAGNWPRYRKP